MSLIQAPVTGWRRALEKAPGGAVSRQPMTQDKRIFADGLNEIDRAQVTAGRKALRGHCSDYRQHVIHLSCRTADFDAEGEANPEVQVLPSADLWTVQELVDNIGHWDGEGDSDVRDYLRFHLGETNGRRLYDQVRHDERLTTLVRLPLFLWMLKEAAGERDGELPRNRGELLRSFVRAPRVMGRIAKSERVLVEQCLETLGWQMQQAGVLQCAGATLNTALAEARGQQSQPPDALREALKQSGLLIDLGDDRYRLLHQLIQEYAAAAYLLRRGQAGAQLPTLGRDEAWRESCQVALWLDKSLHTPSYLLELMGDASVDLRVRVAAATILGEVGDPRFVRQRYANGVEAIEPQMVRIPAGQAMLGGEDAEAYDNEKPQCSVAIRAFSLAVYPVTNVEFACFIDAGGYDDPTFTSIARCRSRPGRKRAMNNSPMVGSPATSPWLCSLAVKGWRQAQLRLVQRSRCPLWPDLTSRSVRSKRST